MATRGVFAAIVRQEAGILPQILLIQRAGKPDGSGYPEQWELPGGGTDPGETDEQCVVRNALEETGLHIKSTKVASIDFTAPPGVVSPQSDDACVHLCEVVGGKYKSFPTGSHLDARWVTINDLFTGKVHILTNPTSKGFVSRMMKMILAGFHAHQMR